MNAAVRAITGFLPARATMSYHRELDRDEETPAGANAPRYIVDVSLSPFANFLRAWDYRPGTSGLSFPRLVSR